jgi:hypothetical protein
MYSINFLKPELELLLDWYADFKDSKYHYGGSDMIFPSEQVLLSKLRSSLVLSFNFSIEEMVLIQDWTENTIQKKYGTEKYLFGFEQTLYLKIKNATIDTGKR